jgi:hypothetical protein
MNVHFAEERILLLADRLTLDQAEGRAWTKRTDAFGAFAKIGGLIARPKDEEFEIIYRERRLQPFWRLSVHTDYTYERRREQRFKVGAEVQSVIVAGETFGAFNREVALAMTELCREEARKEYVFDGLTKAAAPGLKAYLSHDAKQVSAAELNAQLEAPANGADKACPTVIVPPQARASSLTRDALGQSIPKIEADRILEETVQVEAIDLYYRPVYAFRYRWQGKESVVECDALTGDAKVGGSTFESYVGKFVDTAFLLDVGAEAANMFLPGATLAKIVITQGLKAVAKS